MASEITAGSRPLRNLGWRVTLAALGINLALGILYTWSVIRDALPAEWTPSEKSLPYSIACLVFSIVMVPAGRLQDKLGPRLVASLGGLLVGAGMVLASLWAAPAGYAIGFGFLAGAGIGCGYASATPPAVKWFPPSRTGLIAGLVVSGFGLASVYAAPLAEWLTKPTVLGVQHTMLVLGIAFLVVVVGLAQLLTPPPRGFTPGPAGTPKAGAAAPRPEFSPTQMLRTAQFYMLWFMYACGAGAGLMIIGILKGVGKPLIGAELAALSVAILAVGNGAGRILAGMASDRIGRPATFVICFLSQATLVVLLSLASPGNVLGSVPVVMAMSALIGANYGANLSLFPSITKDYYGLKNFGMNYGFVFTAWGVGGFMLSQLAASLKAAHDTYAYGYYGAAVLLVLAAGLTFALRTPRAPAAAQPVASTPAPG